MSYKKLKIWQLAREISIEIHRMSMELPRYELYETGSQIRRSSKSIRSNIVEGYGRRRFKNDYLRFLIYAHSSVDETRDHLETLYETGSLQNQKLFKSLSEKLNIIGKIMYRFIQGVENQHIE
ncbi:MAG: four helix bundle protein [Balneolaceae bacterium]|nr:four helix bundle protein [Balneolaceae bacterium]